MGEGNDFHRQLLLPTLDRLLALHAGERVLEIACGNGQFARWMAERKVNVVATDLSEKLIELAEKRTRDPQGRITYRVVDASKKVELERLGRGRFDAVVCNMALMDMPTVEPLARAVPRLMKPEGRFVFSVTHPCFNTGDTRRVARWSDEGGNVRESVGVEIRRYLTTRKVRGVAIIGQPEPQPYFERPISALLRPFLRSGLTLDALEEPSFPAPATTSLEPWFSWSKSLTEIPPVLAARLVLGGVRRGGSHSRG
jgi:SAM-dependent methyltransferase